ncbi:MAG: hypothetical protein AB7S50_08290 [Bacteroidales bacterium]
MKTNKLNLIFLLVIVTIFISIFSTCSSEDDSPSLPGELIGTWSKTFGTSPYLCTQTWTFKQHNYTFYESCYSYSPSSYDDEVDEVFLDESMILTHNKTYIAWHVETNKLYLYLTNPGDSKPTLSDNWWVQNSPYYKQ